MAKRKKSMVRRIASGFSKKAKRSYRGSSKVELVDPHLMVYGAIRDKAADMIPDLSMGFLPKGASDVIVLAGAGYLAAKQKGEVGKFGRAVLHGENYNAGKLAGQLVFGSIPTESKNSLFYV